MPHLNTNFSLTSEHNEGTPGHARHSLTHTQDQFRIRSLSPDNELSLPPMEAVFSGIDAARTAANNSTPAQIGSHSTYHNTIHQSYPEQQHRPPPMRMQPPPPPPPQYPQHPHYNPWSTQFRTEQPPPPYLPPPPPPTRTSAAPSTATYPHQAQAALAPQFASTPAAQVAARPQPRRREPANPSAVPEDPAAPIIQRRGRKAGAQNYSKAAEAKIVELAKAANNNGLLLGSHHWDAVADKYNEWARARGEKVADGTQLYNKFKRVSLILAVN
jgi:hypothetical protein